MTFLTCRPGAAASVALLLSLAPTATMAQDVEYFPTPTIGVRSGYAFTQKRAIVGASSSVPLDARFEIILGGDLIIYGADERWRIGADVVFRIGQVGEYYAGAGLAMSDFRREADVAGSTEFGYAFVAGYEMGRARNWSLRPFIEPRWTLIDNRTLFMVGVGINYALEKPF